MSGKAAKATRRDVRRAFRADAVDLLGATVENVNALSELAEAQAKVLRAQSDLLNRDLLGRLRWLLTGK